MIRYACRVEYDGAAYCGWQRQPDAPSVQQTLEEAFSVLARQSCSITGAGRTDAGVHARNQALHIDLTNPIDPADWEHSLNGLLPPDIVVSSLKQVSPEFHARFSATARAYRYYLNPGKTALRRDRVWQCSYAIDWGRIEHEIGCLEGTHDFTAFCASGSGSNNKVCNVMRACLEIHHGEKIFYIEANRFVYRMVRSLVGTLVDIGRGALEVSMLQLLTTHNRQSIGTTAPAQGLVLDRVDYPEELYDA